jgi:hypothetical protein
MLAALGIGAIAACNADKPSPGSADAGGGADSGGSSGSSNSGGTGTASGGASNGGAGGSVNAGGGTSTGGTEATGGAGAAGGAGMTGSGGVADAGAVEPEAGTVGGCSPSCTAPALICDNGTCVECAADSVQCAGATPQSCQNGHWINGTTCGGATPACSGGVCAAAKLVGGILTVANGGLSAGGIRLVRHGFEFASKTCGTVGGSRVCLTGGIRP